MLHLGALRDRILFLSYEPKTDLYLRHRKLSAPKRGSHGPSLGLESYPVQTTFMILAGLLGIFALPVVAGAVYQTIGTRRDRRRFPPPGRLVRVNERRMHIHVTGEGTPTVVFESGMGASCLSWTLVQPQVAQFTRAVSYDRSGHDWSDPAREPRTAQQIARDDLTRRSALTSTSLLESAWRSREVSKISRAVTSKRRDLL